MDFADSQFWACFLGGVFVIALLRSILLRMGYGRLWRVGDKISILLLGFVLLGMASSVTLIIFLLVSCISYGGLAWILRHVDREHQTRCLWTLIPSQLLPLLYYKYAHFFAFVATGESFNTLRDLIIPVGISFYSFQLIGFALDTLKHRHPLPTLLDFLLFAGFFPQIVAGPIERRDSLLPQMEQFRFRWNPQDIDEGVRWIILGLFFKCCLADNFAGYFCGINRGNAWMIWWDNVVFSFRIYFDFCGYGLTALGVARCLGVRLTLNFGSPYIQRNVSEYWRRWHVSLTQWFRDYIYFPMGGNRTPWWMINILVVFIISGFWHGAGWNFIVWGGINAVFMLVHRYIGYRIPLPALLSWGLTLFLAFGVRLFFYETNMELLWSKTQSLFSLSAYSGQNARVVLSFVRHLEMPLLIFLLTAGVMLAEWWSHAKQGKYYILLLRTPSVCLMFVCLLLLAGQKGNGFIYFVF